MGRPVAQGRGALRVEPDPIAQLLADRRLADDQVVALIEDHVVPEVFDSKRVRDFLDRFGPLDPLFVDNALVMVIDFGGADQHLDQLLADLLSQQEAR